MTAKKSMIPPGWYEATGTKPKTTQPVTQASNTNNTSSTANYGKTVVQPTITNNSDGTKNYSYDYSNGGFSQMWKDGQIHSVENGSLDKYTKMGYELDTGQWADVQRGTPQQGYGTLVGLPAGMSDDDYFRQYMNTTAADYYMSQATNPQVTQQNSFNSENDARIKALEQMLLDMQNKNAYNQSQATNQGVTSGTPGQHIFTPQNEEVAPGTPGYTQSNNSMNDTLYRYLNNIWQGGM